MTVDELVALIKSSKQHKYIYHFTDPTNFETIGTRGLLSKQKMRDEGWSPAASGGNQLSWELDLYRGIDPYVSLCMTRHHGMAFFAQQDGRLPNLRYLAIQPEVLKIEGTKIALGVANANDTIILPATDAIERMDLEVLYKRTDWSKPDIQARLRIVEKYEVLIPHNVPRNLIAGIC